MYGVRSSMYFAIEGHGHRRIIVTVVSGVPSEAREHCCQQKRVAGSADWMTISDGGCAATVASRNVKGFNVALLVLA